VRWSWVTAQDEAFQAFRYVVVSAGALGVDVVVGWLCHEKIDLSISLSSSVGYVAGLLVAFPILRSFVFLRGTRSAVKVSSLYLISAAIGLCATWGFSALAVASGVESFIVAKLLAAGLSFVTVFLFRKFFVFI